MKKITEWGQIRLVCPCGGNPELPYDFELKKVGGLIYYQCTGDSCRNEFSSDIHLKVMDLLNKYHDKHHTFEGFSHYFRVKQYSMRLRYVETVHVVKGYETIVVEVANLTLQPEYRKVTKNKS